MNVVAFINEKGGTGKTTLCVNTAAYFALKRRQRVLILDLDSQGHAGKSLGVDVRQAPLTTLDLLTQDEPDWRAAITPTRIKGLDLIPSNKRLSEFAMRIATQPEPERRLQRLLARMGQTRYDVLFIDAPPQAGPITQNILLAATTLVIPVALTYLGLDGCAEVVASLHEIKARFPDAKGEVGLVVPTMYRPTRLANEIVAKLAAYFPDRVSSTVLGFHVRIDEAQSYGKTIWEYEPEGKGAAMLAALAVELHNRVLAGAPAHEA